MAEYAGLEIRIGGNTTKLTNALKASTKSAAELQSRIRQATRAMQFDPTSLTNVETRIKLTGDRMQSLQAKAQLARTALSQLGSTDVTLGGTPRHVSEIVGLVDNLSLSAKQADERFVGLRDSLANVYEIWNNAARTAGADFMRDKLGIDADTANDLMSTKTSLSTLLTELKEINEYRKTSNDGRAIITDEEIAKLQQLKQLDFHGMFENGQDLEKLVEQARKLGVVIDDNVVDSVQNMRKEFVGAQQDKQALDKALQFDQLKVDIERLDSEVVSLSEDMRRLDDGVTVGSKSEQFQALEAQLRTVDAAIDTVNDDLERTEGAMRLDPNNLSAAVRYFEDLQQKASLSEERVSILKQQLETLNTAEVQQAAQSHQDLARWIEDSAEAARKARADYSDQQATVANLDDQVQQLKQHIAMLGKDSSTAAMTDNVQRWLTKTNQLEIAMQTLSDATTGLEKAKAELSRLEGEVARAKSEYDELTASLARLRAERKEAQGILNGAVNSGDLATVEQATSFIEALDGEIAQLQSSCEISRRTFGELSRSFVNQSEVVGTFETQIDKAKTNVTELSDAVKKLENTGDVRAFKDFPGEIEQCNDKLNELQTELADARTEEERLKNAYDSAKSENELAKSANKVRELDAELIETQGDAKVAGEALNNLKLDHILNPSTIKSLGMTLSATITPVVMNALGQMTEASEAVDSAYRDMRKTVNGTEEDFEHLREAAINFSRTHVTSADQILEIEAIGGELGIAVDNLETFAEVVSNLEVASDLDAEEAATALGHLSNILHLTEEDYVGFSDALVRLGNNGASTESEIVSIAERIGSMGAIVGMSASDILAWSSTIASTGQNAEAAGTAISRTMSFMETAVAAAGGTLDTSFDSINAAVEEGGDRLTVFASLAGMTAEEFSESWETSAESMAEELNSQLEGARDSLQMIADVAHMSAEEFIQAWESDPTAALEAFIKGLNDLEASGGSADMVLQDLGIRSVRQKQAIEGLMQTVGMLDDNLEMSANAWNGVSDQWGQAGDAANEAGKKAEGFAGQMQLLRNAAQIAFSELGEGAVPILKELTSLVSELSAWFSSLDTSAKTAIVGIGGVTALLGPVLTIMSTARTGLDNIKSWFNDTVNAMAVVRAVLTSGGKAAADALEGSTTALLKFKAIMASVGASALTFINFAAIAGGIITIALAIKELSDAEAAHQRATSGLSDALYNIGKSSYEASEGVEAEAVSLRTLTTDAADYENRLAHLADTISESNEQYGTYAGRLDYYAGVMRDLGGRTDLTKEETAKLSAAVSALNEELGTTYGFDEYGQLIDTSTGKVVDNTEAIYDNIEARKNQALINFYADDYAEATENWAAAQDRVNDLQDEYNRLTSAEGHEAFVNDRLAFLGGDTVQNRIDAEKAYEFAVNAAESALHDANEELDRTSEAMSTIEDKMSTAQEELDESNKRMEEAERAQEAYAKRVETVTNDTTGNMSRLSAAVTDLGKGDDAFNSIAEGLEAINVFADELDNVDMSALVSAFDEVDGSMADVIATLEDAGVSTATWHAAIDEVPEAAERMSWLSSAAFNALYETAGGDLNATMELIGSLERMEIGDKTFFIGDGGTIMDSQGRIYDLNQDLAEIPDEVIVRLAGEDSDLRDRLLEDKRKLTELDNTTATPTVNLIDYATAKLENLRSRLASLSYMRTNTVVTATTQATGGMNSRPVIPRNATGFIATGPTLTNQGWIGEDGIEAVANWATGGAVVPLTNRKYMLPIADAIADGMSKRGSGGVTNNYTVIIDGARVNDIPEIQSATYDYLVTLKRYGEM